MKKIALALVCAAALMLGACTTQTGGSSSSSSLPSIGSSSSSPDSSSASGSSSSSPAGESSSQSEEEPLAQNTAFDEMMEGLAGYQQGTAGSSLKVYVAACGVLNFSQQYDAAQEEAFRADLEAYLQGADALTLEAIVLGQEDVKNTIEDLLTNGVQSQAEMLESAGNPNQYDQYDREKYEAVAQIFDEILQSYNTAA